MSSYITRVSADMSEREPSLQATFTTSDAFDATLMGLLLALSVGDANRIADQSTVILTGSGKCTAAQATAVAVTTPQILRTEPGSGRSKQYMTSGKARANTVQ